MSDAGKPSPLAPFRVRSFRFQWPADLLTSWAFEMETLILAWYILVETDSVLLLTVFGSLQFLGTLIAPMFGLAGDRRGRRALLCGLRAGYTLLAAALMGLALLDLLNPVYVFALAILAGLIRPSDLVMRNSLIGDTMPPGHLMNAMGVSRTTMDSARVVGALAGAGLFSTLGLGPAYAVVTGFYLVSFCLTLGVSRARPAQPETAEPTAPPSYWHELKAGIAYVWVTPQVLAMMWLAFLVNLTAFPISHGLLPFIAREIYRTDENGLAQLIASYAAGALLGSLTLAIGGGARRPARVMVLGILLWFALLLVFGQLENAFAALAMLFVIGLVQSFAMISMSVSLLQTTGVRFRGVVMGIRMLAVYGLPVGLMASSLLVEWLGFPTTVVFYSLIGIASTLLVWQKWRHAIWR